MANSENVIVSAHCYCENKLFASYCNVPRELIQGKQVLARSTATPFDNILHLSNRVAQNVLGDGNCFFRCLSQYFLGTEEFHRHIREKIVNFMITHIDVFSRYISQNNRHLTVNEYLLNMSSTHGSIASWATDVEIEATATLLQVPIYVLGRWGHGIAWQKFTPRFTVEKPFKCSYITLLNTGGHYMIVKSSRQL